MLKAAKRAAVEAASAREQAGAAYRGGHGADEPRRQGAARNRRRPVDGTAGRSAGGARAAALGSTASSRRRARSKVLRARFPGLTIVTPGIRASSAPADDQSRTLSAARRSPRAPAISWWAARSSPRPIPAAPPRKSRDRAPDDLQQARLPSVRRDEVRRPSRRSQRPTEISCSTRSTSPAIPTLLERYGLEIPVLMIDGRKAAKYRVSEEELTRMLEAKRVRK